MGIGRRVLGLGTLGLGVIGLVWGDFVMGQAAPEHLPQRVVLAYVAAVIMVLGGLGLQFDRTAVAGAWVLTAYYWVVSVVLFQGAIWVKHFAEFGMYEDLAEEVAIATGLLVVLAVLMKWDKRMVRLGQVLLGLCAVVFGIAHFVYMNMTAPLVPKWMVPGQVFWGYATGVCFVAAGLALVSGFKARLAAGCMAAMIGVFFLVVHVPMVIKAHSLFNWTEAAINLSVLGAAWVVGEARG
jgi:uncharacterized membrane protein